MITFQPPTLSDKAWVDELLAHGGERGCEYNFTTLFNWRHAYCQEIAREGDFFVERLCGRLGRSYLWPIGPGDAAPVLALLRAQAHAEGMPLRFACLTEPHLQQLEALYPGQFTAATDRDGWDYLYEVDRLAELPGKKLHAKRNHIRRLMDAYPDWTFEPITPENLSECRALDLTWHAAKQSEQGTPSLEPEHIALHTAFDHYAALDLEGGLIRAGGEVLAFTIGDPLSSDTYLIHFEKARPEVQGAYALINREFARYIRARHPHVRYLNREEDLGLEGLRRAKLSYYPDLMVEKYSAVERAEGELSHD